MNNRILLVDDEETIRYVLRDALISDGYDVDIAGNAFQALEYFKPAQYDLMITDINMHGMDGFQLIREMKRYDSHLKIIIMTANDPLETVKEAAKLGVVGMISKPFKIQKIKDVIVMTFNERSISKDIDRNRIGQLQEDYDSPKRLLSQIRT